MVDHSYDSTGIDPDSKGSSSTIPEGEYKFKIIKANATKSKSGYFMVELECQIMDNLELMGKTLPHWVTFLPRDNKGAGIAIHFLKVIGQPWEGKFDITVSDWEGEEFSGVVKNEPSEYKGKTYMNSKIKFVNYLEAKKEEAEIPF